MHRLTILIASAAIGVGALACGSSSGASAATVKIEAGDFYFKPADIRAVVGKATKIRRTGGASRTIFRLPSWASTRTSRLVRPQP